LKPLEARSKLSDYFLKARSQAGMTPKQGLKDRRPREQSDLGERRAFLRAEAQETRRGETLLAV
jgi:hypothetical protein